jgi:hypothetical protein
MMESMCIAGRALPQGFAFDHEGRVLDRGELRPQVVPVPGTVAPDRSAGELAHGSEELPVAQ